MYFLCLLKYNMLHIISSHTEHNVVIDNIINNIAIPEEITIGIRVMILSGLFKLFFLSIELAIII